MKHIDEEKLAKLKNECLVFDLETWATNTITGEVYDIRLDFDNYVKYAKVRWFGAYSYKFDEDYMMEFEGNEEIIRRILDEHSTLVSFNGIEFDFPILKNNNVIPKISKVQFDKSVKEYNKNFLQVDMLVILGTDVNVRKHKNRAGLMGYSLPNNKLATMAKVFNLDVQKGDIDYQVFEKRSWTPQEKEEIIKYLKSDVYATKQLFEKTWDFWKIFTIFLDDRNIENLSWIRSSIASLTYKSACYILGAEETYSDEKGLAEDMGGRVIEPKYQDAMNVWYVDFTSLYPHMMVMFELFTQVNTAQWCNMIREMKPHLTIKTDDELLQIGQDAGLLFHKNDVFEAKGYYDISKMSIQNIDMRSKLELRIGIKNFLKSLDENNYAKDIPDVVADLVQSNPLTNDNVKYLKDLMYAIKIYINSYYGAFRSKTFEAIHQPDGGWDTCLLGQTVNYLTEKMMDEFGFETIAGDTDSVFLLAKEEKYNNKDYVMSCLKKVVDKVNENVPFPCDTFNLDLEGGDMVEYVKWAFDYKKDKKTGELQRIGKKKNYLYVQHGKVKIMGLPIKKSNATRLGGRLLREYLIPKITAEGHANFSEGYLKGIVKEHASADMMAILYNCKPVESYSAKSHINCQASIQYTDGLGGQVFLVKNKKVGKIGNAIKRVKAGKPLLKSSWFYGTVEECEREGISVDDLHLEKIFNELSPFFEEDRYLR